MDGQNDFFTKCLVQVNADNLGVLMIVEINTNKTSNKHRLFVITA